VRHPVHLSLLWPWSESGSGTLTVTLPGDGDEHYYVECLEEQLIQGFFALDQWGTVWLDEKVQASSIEHFIEGEAVIDELMDVQSEWCQGTTSLQVVRGIEWLDEHLALPHIDEASSQYGVWWGNDQVRAVRWTTGQVRAYARTMEEMREVMARVTGRSDDSDYSVRTWPYRAGAP